jgi:hypothetical protein
VNGILNHSREKFLDYVIANTEEIPEEILEKYITDGSRPVRLQAEDELNLAKKGIKLIKGRLIDVEKNYIRHDNIELSKLLVDLANNGNNNGGNSFTAI